MFCPIGKILQPGVKKDICDFYRGCIAMNEDTQENVFKYFGINGRYLLSRQLVAATCWPKIFFSSWLRMTMLVLHYSSPRPASWKCFFSKQMRTWWEWHGYTLMYCNVQNAFRLTFIDLFIITCSTSVPKQISHFQRWRCLFSRCTLLS